MAKITLDTITSGFQSTSQVNNNNADIATNLNDKVLYRDNPTGEPNQMVNLLDMNSNQIINLPIPSSPTSPLRVKDISDTITVSIEGLVVFDTALDMIVSVVLSIGDKVSTLGYNTIDDGGANTYEIVASGTGTNDGVSFLNLSVGLQAKGLFSSGSILLKQAGLVGDGVTSDTVKFTALQAFVPTSGKLLANGENVYPLNILGWNKNLQGHSYATKFKSFDGTTPVITLASKSPDHTSFWIRDLTIDGNSLGSHGIDFGDDHTVNGWHISNVELVSCNYGIHKQEGQIENMYDNVHFFGCNFGYRAVGQVSPIRHAGADLFLNCEFDNNILAGIYIDSPVSGTGQTRIEQCIFQGNPGFGIFVKNWNTSFTPLVLDNVWFEGNHTESSVIIDTIAHTPRDILFTNTAQAIITNSRIDDFETNRANVFCTQSFANDDSQKITKTTEDIFIFSDCYTDSWKGERVESIIGFTRKAGNFADVLDTHPRRIIGNAVEGLDKWHSSRLVMGNDFNNKASYNFPGTISRNGIARTDGIIFNGCCELVLEDNDLQLFDSATIVDGKFYCWSIDLNNTTTNKIDVSISNSKTLVSAINSSSIEDEWSSYAGCTQGDATSAGVISLNLSNSSGGQASIRISAFQVVEFDNKQDCIDYLRAGVFLTATRPNRIFVDAQPTAGSFTAGDFAENTSSSAFTPDVNNMVLFGWRRATTGSANVLNTDWFANFLSTVTPAT